MRSFTLCHLCVRAELGGLPLQTALGTKRDPAEEIRVLGRRLRQALAEPDVWVVLDFFGVRSIPKERFVDAILADLPARFHDAPRVAMVNLPIDAVSDDGPGAGLAPKVVPMIDVVGRAVWPGCENEGLKRALNMLWDRGALSIASIERTSGLSAADRQSIDRRLRDNPHLFRFDEEAREWRTYLTRHRVGAALQGKFENWLREVCEGIKQEGHYELPSRMHTDTYYQMDLLLRNPEIVRTVAIEVCRRSFRGRYDVLLVYSLLALAIAGEVLDVLGECGVKIRYIPTYGYPAPRPRLGDRIEKGERVLVLSDSISSGAAVANLKSYARVSAARRVGSLVLIDTNGLRKELDTDALVSVDVELTPRSEQCDLCKRRLPLVRVDEFTSSPRPLARLGSSFESMLDGGVFWRMAMDAGAIRREHVSFNGHHFTLFIEMPKILRKRAYAEELAAATLRACQARGLTPDVLIHPNHESAMLFARALWSRLDGRPSVVPAYRAREDGSYKFARQDAQILAGYAGKVTLIVDDGANFGGVLLGIYFAVKEVFDVAKEQEPRIECAVILNRLHGTYERTVTTIIGEHLLSLYRLESPPPYHEWDCPLCMRMRELELKAKEAPSRSLREYYLREAQHYAVAPVDMGIHA